MEFEWDEANVGKHGIDFLFAQALFDGRLVITAQSPRGSEDRYATTGRMNGGLSPQSGMARRCVADHFGKESRA